MYSSASAAWAELLFRPLETALNGKQKWDFTDLMFYYPVIFDTGHKQTAYSEAEFTQSLKCPNT